jgi:hypothetical protein
MASIRRLAAILAADGTQQGKSIEDAVGFAQSGLKAFGGAKYAAGRLRHPTPIHLKGCPSRREASDRRLPHT